MDNNGKQPAFPILTSEMGAFGSKGLSKREWFAGLAMQGFLANPNDCHQGDIPMLCRDSVRYADALLKALAESEVSNG